MWWTISSALPSLGASWSATARQRRNISETDKKTFQRETLVQNVHRMFLHETQNVQRRLEETVYSLLLGLLNELQ